jgi:hypothetical protein
MGLEEVGAVAVLSGLESKDLKPTRADSCCGGLFNTSLE